MFFGLINLTTSSTPRSRNNAWTIENLGVKYTGSGNRFLKHKVRRRTLLRSTSFEGLRKEDIMEISKTTSDTPTTLYELRRAAQGGHYGNCKKFN